MGKRKAVSDGVPVSEPGGKRGSKAKRWCFTSYSDSPPTYDSSTTEYLCYGKELCPTTGRQHWQGFICLYNRAYLSGAKKIIGASPHMELCRGTIEENQHYCAKDGDFVEHGTPPQEKGAAGGRATKELYTEARRHAEAGEFALIDDQLYIQYVRNLHYIRDYQQSLQTVVPLPPGFLTGIWIKGAPGVGKSHLARAVTTGHAFYEKDHTKWWDGYTNEAIVIIDDVDPQAGATFGSHLKLWADRYPYKAERKGSVINIRPTFVIVTSNYSIQNIWWEKDEVLCQALARRFVVWYLDAREEQSKYSLPAFPPSENAPEEIPPSSGSSSTP